ncbi:hypothetical protein BDV93DRAFT_528382 [Ceratobasidium sp. AG-I]|nr:hypothetical protein BDV93DRAFT_528382 [Ceratobasidium sp. AG-I]
MSHPLVWPCRPTFNPLGGSPAISLTQDLSPDQSADILLLGCGDVYNVLFTISTDVTLPSGPRNLDITCCDLEPAVLARNLLVFTLLHDDSPVERIWDIYYHFKLDGESTNLLVAQCRQLIEVSQSMDTWRQSSYNSFLKIADSNTLSELRRHWTLYAGFPEITGTRLNKLKKEQEDLSRKIKTRLRTYGYMGASRSAAFMRNHTAKTISDQYGVYWQTGTTSTVPADIKEAQQLNPTWVYSLQGEKFAPHDNTYPQAFHFVSAVSPITSDPAGPATPSVMNKAKQQFKVACSAFESSRKAGAVTLRFVLGDALQFCYALQGPSANVITAPWRCTFIDLADHFASSPPPPQTFDVIDTSDLMNSLGAINILLATQPLLKKSPATQSMVYTEYVTISEEAAVEIFIEQICSDPSNFSALVGLLPRAYISAFDSHSVTHEVLVPESRDHNQRMAWVDPTSGDNYARKAERPVTRFASGDFAKTLGDMYPQMFFFDNVPEFFAPATMAQLRTWSEPHHTRETVAMVFRHAQRRVEIIGGTWDEEIDAFLDIVKKDKDVYLGARYREDLLLHLSLAGVRRLGSSASPGSGVFQGWSDVPTIVCIVIIVPSAKLDIIRADDEAVPPKLVCALRKGAKGATEIHSSIHPVWGKCVPTSDGKFTVEEDPTGMHGGSDLIVSFWASSKILERSDVRVSLALRYTPLTLKIYRDKLGPDFELFSTRLENEKHVHVVRERPMGNSKFQSIPQLESTPIPNAQIDTTFRVEGGHKPGFGGMPRWYIKTLTGRLDVQSPAEQKSLLDGAEVKLAQIAPCTVRVSFGEYAHVVIFPYPIRESRTKLRVARKSHYVELVAPPFNPLENGYPLIIFPVLHNPHLTPWNLHHICLDKMPILNNTNPQLPEWLTPHISLQWSDRELAEQASGRVGSDSINNLKTCIWSLISDYTGIRSGAPLNIFTFQTPTHDIELFILVSCMRVDFAGDTIVLDSAVIPASDITRPSLNELLFRLSSRGPVFLRDLMVEPQEMILWKRILLPVFTERCRTWSHMPNCEYASRGTVPHSLEADESQICSCGVGIGFAGPEWPSLWKDLLSHATRAAISTIFPVPYLELVAGPAINGQSGNLPQSDPAITCWECGNVGGKLMACGKCKTARYCSTECQKKNWKKHKPNCKAS